MELYNVQQFNQQSVPLPTPPVSEDGVMLFPIECTNLLITITTTKDFWVHISLVLYSVATLNFNNQNHVHRS